MEENTQNTADQAKPDDMLDQLNDTLGNLKDKAGDALNTAEDKAKELWDKASNSEAVKETREKLEDLAEGAKGLWDKLVNKLDGDNEELKS